MSAATITAFCACQMCFGPGLPIAANGHPPRVGVLVRAEFLNLVECHRER